MSQSQGPGGGALEPHPYGGGFGPPPSSGKDPYSPPSTTNGNGLTELGNSDSSHLTLLKSSNGLPGFTSFGDSEGLGSRLSDAFSEMRYVELQNWDLSSYSSEGLSARLIDSRSIESPDQIIQYRPWEKPDSNQSHSPTLTSSGNNINGGGSNNTVTTTNSGTHTHNGNGTNNDKSPTTLTPLTNAFPTFSDAFNGHKLPSFQSQFNAFQDQPIGHPLGHHHHLGDHTGAAALPSFHTLPANRGYVHPPPHGHLHGHPVPHGHPSPHGHPHHGHPVLVTTPVQAREIPNIQQQFLDERHIQLFPGQLAAGQFGQLIATTTAQPMAVTNGHHHLNPPHHHFVMTNGSNHGGNFSVSGIPTSSSSTLQLQELVPVPPMQLLHPAAAPTNNSSTISTTSSKLPQTTDGSIPGLNLNLIDPHLNANNHLNLNLNVPKYLSSSDGPIETHLIAVKIPPNSFEHSGIHHAHQMPPHHNSGAHHHHSITKIEQQSQQQNSPQIVSNSHNSTNNSSSINNHHHHHNNNNTPTTKRQQKRKRNSIDSGENHQTHTMNHHHQPPTTQHQQINTHLNHNHNHQELNDPQVSSVSSSDSDFKRPNLGHNGTPNGNGNGLMSDGVDPGLEKPVKKKRKRCGECTGCQKKDNCGDCAPCRNDKSHQICKVRRCEKLTEKKPNARGEKMDGRGRQGSNNSGAAASAASSMMSPYGYPNSQPTTASDNSSSFSPRDRFWSTPGSAGTPESWGGQSYTPQMGVNEISSFSPNQPSPGSQHSFNLGNNLNIPSHSPYPPPPPPQTNGGGNSLPELGFSGPSPPNPIQPISVSSSPYPPPPSSISPRRQYTPSTTPSPHITHQSPSNSNNSNVNGINGNGINGNSNHSSSSTNESPPMQNPNNNNNNNNNNSSSNNSASSTFESYLNGEGQSGGGNNNNNTNGMNGHSSVNSNGQVPNGLENGHGQVVGKSGANDPTGHPNELPGYLPHPRQSLHSSSRYPGEIKASDGEMMHQYPHHPQHQQQNPYYHHQSQNYGNYASSNSNYPPYPPGNNMDSAGFHTPQQSSIRRPFDPYQPYQNPNSESGYGENFGPQTQQHDHHHHFRPSTSTPSSGPGSSLGRESGKVEELLENGNGQRKIDPCESLQILPGKTTGNSGSGPRAGSGSSTRPFDDGSAVNFEATLMNLNSSHHSHHSLAHHQQHSQQTQSHQQDSSSCSSQSPSSYDLHFGAVPPPLSHEMQQHMQQPGSQSSESSSTGPPPPLGSKINHSVSKTEESNNNNNRKNSNNSDTIVAKGKTKNNNNNSSKKNKNNNSTFSFNDEMDFENLESNNKQTETFLASGHPQSPTKLGNTNPLTAAKGSSPESQRRKKFGSSNISTSSSISDTVMNVSTSISSSANNPNSEGGDRVSPLISSGSGSVTNSTNSNNPNSQQKPNPGPAKKKKAKKNKQTGNGGNGNNNNNSANKFSDENSTVKDQKCGVKGNDNSKFNNIRVKDEPKDRDFDKNQTVNFRLGGNASNNVKMKVEDDDGPMMHHGSLIDSDTEDGADDKEKKDVPMVECGCFPADEVHAEPGPFYTHLGAAHTLVEMRESIETRTGFRGQQIRFEKVIYTGKEGKTSQGCPLAKWIIRRGSYEEQLLFLVKHRKGHKCSTAWIVVCCVIWEGVPPHFADNLYDTMVYKLNRFGIPTTRRSDTNEQRSCACQGVDPDTCGAAYSFGCAWSMFFNGCKYARSRNVRKFRLTEEHEESELEEKVQHLATHLAPLYERVAPESYRNQVEHENEGLECRLGYRPGRPFSGVTACLDYASHAHKDAHNMINGCTVTVSFTRNRTLGKGDDEQYHVFPLYKLDDTDEHGSKDGQKQKVKKGQLEILKKFPCKVRVRKVPLLPSRRRGKAKPPSSSSSSTNSGGSGGGGGGGGGGGSSGGSTGGTGGSGGGGLTTSASANSPGSSSIKSPDYSDMPPLKREKVSLFDEHLTNGTGSGGSMGSSGAEQSSLFDSRFHPAYSHHPHHPFSNLLMPNNHNTNYSHAHSPVKLGMSLEEVQSSQISSTVLDSECATSSVAAAAAAASLWNHFGHGATGGVGSHHGSPSAGASAQSHGHLTPPSAAATSPFRSYFDHPFSSSSAASSQSGGHSGSSVSSPFGHSSSLTDLSSNTLSSSRHSSSSNPNLSSCNPSGGIPIGGGGGLLGGGANHIITIGGVPSGSSNNNLSPNPSSGNVTPGYSSMSPILPSFRHTFMTEAESMSMISSMSSPPSGGSPPDSTSSPRSAPPPHHHHPHSHNHHSSSSSSHHHHHSHHSHHHHKSNSSTPGSNHSSSSSAPAAAGSAASLAASRESSGLGPFATSSALGEPSYFHPGQSNYASSAASGAPPPSGGLYHPHPHNPCLPSMSMSSSQVGGVPFSTSSMLSSNSMASMSSPYGGGMGPSASSVSSFGPPAPPEHHFGMNMNSMNPLNPWNAPTPSSYSSNYSAAAAAAAYGSSAVYHPHAHPQASSLNMNMGSMSGMGMSSMSTPNFGHPMNVNMNINQYSPYQNTIQQQIQQQQQLQNIQSQMSNSWAPPPLPFAPNMNMNMHPHPHAPPPPSCFVAPPKPKVIPEVNESFSDNEDAFKDTHLGGVAIALTHGAVVLQCAKHEMHATTALKTPNRLYPSRICLVFYQHKSMNNRFHGWSEWEKKIEAKKLQEVKLINQGKMEASPRKMKQLIKEGYLTDNP